VQFVEVVLAQAQWAKQSAAIQSHVPMFPIGVQMVMKSDHHLQSKKQLLFQLNGIAQNAVTQQDVIATILLVQK
jgi:hypothetical protein